MSLEVLSLIGILVSLALIMFLAYKGISIYVIAPLASVLICIFSRVNPLESLTGPYMAGFAGFAQRYFLLFLLSAIFGRMMGDVGAAKCIAYKTAAIINRFDKNKGIMGVFALVLIQATLTYGGISVFVAIFTVVVIAKEIFKELDLPWRLYTCGSLGSSVFTMSMLPGSPSIQNLIPIPYLGTNAMAAPTIGIISSLISIILGYFYIRFRVNQAKRNGEGFLPTGTKISEAELRQDSDEERARIMSIPLWKCLLPSVILIIVLNVFKQDPVIALFVAVIVTIILFWDQIGSVMGLNAMMKGGSINAVGSITSVCAAVGFGRVVASVAGYQLILDKLQGLDLPPIFQVIIAVNVAAGVTGSASGGLGIALDTMADKFLATGLNPQVIHRLSVMSSGGLDSLPHNGAIIFGINEVAKLTHKEAYINFFVLTVIMPIVVTIFAGFLATIGLV